MPGENGDGCRNNLGGQVEEFGFLSDGRTPVATAIIALFPPAGTRGTNEFHGGWLGQWVILSATT